MKQLITLLLLTITYFLNAQVLIPNPNFEAHLVSINVDTDGIVNGQISTNDALAVTNLDISSLSLTDIIGINGFTNLAYLSAFSNNFTSLNLNLQNLVTLYLDNNNLTSLDLSAMPVLTDFNARNNPNLSSIIPHSSFLYETIRLGGCAFTGNIDLGNFTNLQILEFSNNNITSMITTGVTSLEFLAVDNCGLSSLDLTDNVNLTNLTALNNNLTCLDLSNNSILTGVEINGNDPNLQIVVSNVAAANIGSGIYQNWYKDSSATYVTACSTSSNNDYTFGNTFSIYPNPIKNNLTIDSNYASKYILFDVIGKTIKVGNFNIGNNTLNTSNLNNGIYFLKITSQGKIFTKKLIKK